MATEILFKVPWISSVITNLLDDGDWEPASLLFSESKISWEIFNFFLSTLKDLFKGGKILKLIKLFKKNKNFYLLKLLRAIRLLQIFEPYLTTEMLEIEIDIENRFFVCLVLCGSRWYYEVPENLR